MDRETIEVYNRSAAEWTAEHKARDWDHVAWVQQHRSPGPVVDIGCGPGWHLPSVAKPAVALDASRSMLELAADRAPGVPRLLASADALPFARGTLGGALANRVYVHLPAVDVPLALADLHGALEAEAPAFIRVIGDELGDQLRSSGNFAGRLYSAWSDERFRDVCHGAGLSIEHHERVAVEGMPDRLAVRVRRVPTLADTVGPSMRLLICGLNPSPSSAASGIGFAKPGNRFWPAALQVGLVRRDRDPRHALTAHGVGMTDLVKRPTRTAAELDVEEYRAGLERVTRLATWLQPAAICFVGLAGWRAAVDRKAAAGPQPKRLGPSPVYVMPSTSGLNAHSQLPDLAAHLQAALRLADQAD